MPCLFLIITLSDWVEVNVQRKYWTWPRLQGNPTRLLVPWILKRYSVYEWFSIFSKQESYFFKWNIMEKPNIWWNQRAWGCWGWIRVLGPWRPCLYRFLLLHLLTTPRHLCRNLGFEGFKFYSCCLWWKRHNHFGLSVFPYSPYLCPALVIREYVSYSLTLLCEHWGFCFIMCGFMGWPIQISYQERELLCLS